MWELRAKDDSRIDVEKWVQSLSKVSGPVNGMEYNGVDEVLFRKTVVAAVCHLIASDVRYDVSHVQALPQLCEAINHKMEELKPRVGCPVVVGLFGTGGMGKTTISKAMCNASIGEYIGKVCLVEFGSANFVELRKKVLQELTGAGEEHLPSDGDKLLHLLKIRVQEHKVFLSLDNVLLEDDIREANLYLNIQYGQGSQLLVTSRSLEILKSLRLRESDCMEMPFLNKQDATIMFLRYARCEQKSFNASQLNIVQACVQACQFSKRGIGDSELESETNQYLPLALKVWGSQLGAIGDDPLGWHESLKALNEHKFNYFKEQRHPLFSLLRQGYDALDLEEQHIFMDLALFFPHSIDVLDKNRSAVDWLSIIHRCSKDSIRRSLNCLKRKALIEELGNNGLEFKIHDLFLEFAREEAQVGPFAKQRILYQLNMPDIPRELLKRPSGGIWESLERLALYGSEVKSLTRDQLSRFCNVEMLQLYHCHQLVVVDVQGMENLISLDVVGCRMLGAKLEGVEKLGHLAWLRWRGINETIAPLSLDLSSLTALQFLHLDCDLRSHQSVVPPDLSGCIHLREVQLEGFLSLRSLPDLSNLLQLEKFYCQNSFDVESVVGLTSLTNLKVLKLGSCRSLTEFPGLCSLTSSEVLNRRRRYLLQRLPGLGDLAALETLDLSFSSIPYLHNLQNLRRLQVLQMVKCEKLTSLCGLEYLTSLRYLDVRECENLMELPDCNNLTELKVLDLSGSGVCILPSDFGRLAKHHILRMRGCVGLFEALVVWLLDQRQQMFEEFDGWMSSGFLFVEQTMDQLWSRIKEVFAYYMKEVLCDFAGFFDETPIFSAMGILSSPCILGGLEGGITPVIRLLCENDDLGILGVVVAKYAARGECRWALLGENYSITPALCRSIALFLDQQLQAMVQRVELGDWEDWTGLPSRMSFILHHLTKDQVRLYSTYGQPGYIQMLDSSRMWTSLDEEFVACLVDLLEQCWLRNSSDCVHLSA